jgi:hypothetical protein
MTCPSYVPSCPLVADVLATHDVPSTVHVTPSLDAFQVMGGEQFSPEEIAEAERRFEEAHGRQLGGGVGGGGGGAGGEGPGPVQVLPLYAMLSQVRSGGSRPDLGLGWA